MFFLGLRVIGSTMGTRDELERLSTFMVQRGIRPVIDSTYPLADAPAGLERLASGEVFGKIVFTT